MAENLLDAARDLAPHAVTVAAVLVGAYLAYLSGIKLQIREWKRQRDDENRRKRDATESLLVRIMIEACGNLQRPVEQDIDARGQSPPDIGLSDIIRSGVLRLETYDAAFPAIASEGLVTDFTFAFALYYSHKVRQFLIPYLRVSEQTSRATHIVGLQEDWATIRRMLPDVIQATRNVIGRIRLECPTLSEAWRTEAKRLQDIMGSFGLLSEEELQRCVDEVKRKAALTQEASSS
jgi:hypothetical protein